MLKNWDDFNFSMQLLVHQFTMFGVAFTFREDQFDWRWKVYDLQYLKLPRRTRATINDVDMVTCKVEMLPSELWKKIENREAAIEAGWNPDAVEAAIKTAMQRSPDASNPQETQESYKDQDQFTGLSATTVQVIHGWVAEVDGTITHIIGRYDGQGDFLYKCEGLYGSMSQLITAYTYGVGSNGDFYSLRGNAWNGHNCSLMMNLLTCKFLDQAIFAATPTIQASSEDAVIDQMIQPRGPYNVVTQGTTFPEMPHVPFKDSLIPAISTIQQIFSMRTSAAHFSPQMGKSPKNQEQVMTENALAGSNGAAGMTLFFQSWKNDYKEFVRRICNKNYPAGHPGYAEVLEFRKRCLRRGVPMEAIWAVDVNAIQINQGLGKGSVFERRNATNAVMGVIDRLDTDGQQFALRSYLAAHTDVEYANLLVPKQPGQRPPMDLQIANMENSLMSLGQQAVIEPNQNHAIHVGAHLQILTQLDQQLAQMQVTMEEIIPKMQMIWEHAGQHMQMIALLETTSREIVDVKVVPDLLQVIALRARLEDLDGIPVISAVDPLPGLYLSTGFTGHGFGIGPGAGRLAAAGRSSHAEAAPAIQGHHARFAYRAVEDIALAHEVGDERVGRPLVDLGRGRDLLNRGFLVRRQFRDRIESEL